MTLEDLAAFPVWEFGLDEEGVEGRDESWVRPVETEVIPAGSCSQLVAAEFSSRAWVGSLSGFMDITTAKSNHQERILAKHPHLEEVRDPDLEGPGYSTSGGAIIPTAGCCHFIPMYPRIEPFRSQREARVISDRVAFAAALGYEPGDTFPIRYRLLVPIQGEVSCREGVIR